MTYHEKFRKHFVALKLIFGGNEQAIILSDLLVTYAYRSSETHYELKGFAGITRDGYFPKSRSLIMKDTGVLTASITNAVKRLEEEGFIKRAKRQLPGYKEKITHYYVELDTGIYINKATSYLNDKTHRPDDRKVVTEILLPFLNHLTYFQNILDALDLNYSTDKNHSYHYTV